MAETALSFLMEKLKELINSNRDLILEEEDQLNVFTRI